MKKIILGLVAFMGQALFADIISLEQIQEIALEKSYQVKQAKKNVEYYKSEEQVLRSSYLPKIGIEIGQERILVDSIEQIENTKAIYGNINLYKGGEDQIELEKGEIETQKSQSILNQRKLEQSIYLEDLYYRYLYFLKIEELNSSALKRNKLHLKMIKKRLASSLVSDADYLEFKLRGLRLLAKNKYRTLKAKEVKTELLALAKIDNPETYEIRGVLPHLILNESLKELYLKMESSQQLKHRKLTLVQSDLEYKKNQSDWFPKVDLEMKYGNISESDTGINSSQRSTLVALNAKWEFFSGFKTKYSANSIKLNNIRNKYSLKHFQLSSRVKVRNFFSELKNLETLINLEEKNAEIAEQLYGKVLKEYKKGVKDSGALSSISDELTEIKLKIFEHKAKFIAIKLKLEKTLGNSVNFSVVKH